MVTRIAPSEAERKAGALSSATLENRRIVWEFGNAGSVTLAAGLCIHSLRGPSVKFSVIIPCFNERRTINEILSYAHAIPYGSKEIIVVDDGSTGGSMQ